MATGKLIGTDTAQNTSSLANYIEMQRFAGDESGTVNQFRVYANVSGNIKVAIYADSAGSPGARLSVNNDGVAVTGGQWNKISISSLSVTAGTYYWLAVNIDTEGAHVQGGSGATSLYKNVAYSSGLPDPAGSGYTSTTAQFSFAGYSILVLSLSSISQPVSYGSPKLNLSIKPSSIVQAIAYGLPTIVGISGILISPQGIAVIISYCTPILRYPQTISPSSTVSLVYYGVPSVGIFGIIKPQGMAVIMSYGSPRILKYVRHVILDGQYANETPEVNRAYIIGRDQYGNPVYGTAVNTDEIALVGERLDFQPDPAITTTAQATDVAAAVLSKMRLMRNKGVIIIPPNCGQELFDAVQITDRICNQEDVKLRVIGIRFEYNLRQACYQHKLILGTI